LVASLLIGSGAPLPGLAPVAAAEVVEMRLDDLRIPIQLDQLETWQRQDHPGGSGDNDLTPWLALLDGADRRHLRRMLGAPLLRERSFGSQLLDTWAGGQLLGELGTLLTTPDGRSTTPLLLQTLRGLLQTRPEVSLLDVLKAMPTPQLNLQLDDLLELAERWRIQLLRQQRAFQALQALPLPRRSHQPILARQPGPQPRILALPVEGRAEALPLHIWSPPQGSDASGAQPWVLMMPGLGGDAQQLGWLAAALASRGWPVVVMQHPGSDTTAVRDALAGQRRPPGAESLARRLADVQAVLLAQQQGRLPVQGHGLVLAGHSLGGVTALLAAGVQPAEGLDARCREAMQRLPISNPSRLLQCELADRPLPHAAGPPKDLRALVLFNPFGSLLWPATSLSTLAVPVLMVGGSLDLVTPPLDEQLALFLPARDPRSRLLVVDGGSHFSPVRIDDHDQVLLRLSQEWVGVDPPRVQRVLLGLSVDFLNQLQPSAGQRPLEAQRLRQDGVTAYLLDPPMARRWRAGL
jgi:predicted dienelactone hydrolase